MTLPDLPDDLWNDGKPPLERWWDAAYPDWEPAPPQTVYRIWWADSGLACTCGICGKADGWKLENDAPELRVFVCEHEPDDMLRGWLRDIDTVPARQVGRVEVAWTFDA